MEPAECFTDRNSDTASNPDLVLVFDPDGSVVLVRLEPVDIFAVRRLVEGPVALVPDRGLLRAVHPRVELWVNEEGLLRPGMAVNEVASVLAAETLVGPAVCSRKVHPPTLAGFTRAEIDALGWVPRGESPVSVEEVLRVRSRG